MALKKYHVYETHLYLSFIWWGTWGGHLLLASDVGPARPSRKCSRQVVHRGKFARRDRSMGTQYLDQRVVLCIQVRRLGSKRERRAASTEGIN